MANNPRPTPHGPRVRDLSPDGLKAIATFVLCTSLFTPKLEPSSNPRARIESPRGQALSESKSAQMS
eukprot:6199751-Pleurochrysis_carterae.AAC.3